MLADGCSVPSLKEASKVDKHHSERNAHRLFFKYGLALRVPISNLDVPESSGQDMVSIPYLQVTDYLRLLLNHYEEVLVGGLKIEQSVQLCRDFWNRFKSYNKDHLVYDLSEEARSKFIPIMVHGDKGRTLQKSPIFVLSFELPWGLPPELLQRCAYDNKCSAKRQFGDSRLNWTCQHRAKGFGKRSYDEMVFGDCTVGHTGNLKHEAPGNHQRHNSKGHSFLSRFLIAAVPSKVYNKNDKVLPSLLEEVASQLKHLFRGFWSIITPLISHPWFAGEIAGVVFTKFWDARRDGKTCYLRALFLNLTTFMSMTLGQVFCHWPLTP